MSYGWIDGNVRSILNFLVNCPRGTLFIKSINASSYVEDAYLLCDMLNKFIQEIGPYYVVQVIASRASLQSSMRDIL